MTNTNCLQDIQCPKCGYRDRFFISATITADVTDDGSEIADNRGDFEWDDDSPIECRDCGATGTVGEFRVKQPEEPPTATTYTTYQLAADEAANGADAGKFIVTSGDNEQEFSGPMARKDAESLSAALNACRMVVDRWEQGDLAAAARACSAAIADAEMKQAGDDMAEDATPSDDPPPADGTPYFRGASGTRYTYAEIAERIRKEAPRTLGKHITVQLEALRLLEEMQNGATPCGLPFTFAEVETSLLVPSGSPLIEGKLYLQLHHGRNDPHEEMQYWGFGGPTFGPLSSVAQTYSDNPCLLAPNDEELRLERHAEMIAWDGAYYGSVAVFIAGKHDRG